MVIEDTKTTVYTLELREEKEIKEYEFQGRVSKTETLYYFLQAKLGNKVIKSYSLDDAYDLYSALQQIVNRE